MSYSKLIQYITEATTTYVSNETTTVYRFAALLLFVITIYIVLGNKFQIQEKKYIEEKSRLTFILQIVIPSILIIGTIAFMIFSNDKHIKSGATKLPEEVICSGIELETGSISYIYDNKITIDDIEKHLGGKIQIHTPAGFETIELPEDGNYIISTDKQEVEFVYKKVSKLSDEILAALSPEDQEKVKNFIIDYSLKAFYVAPSPESSTNIVNQQFNIQAAENSNVTIDNSVTQE